MAQQQDERSVGQLVASLGQDMSALVRGEMELAKAELRESVVHGVKTSAMFGIAAFLGYVAFLMLSVAAAFGLVAAGLHPALGFLIVAVVFLIIAGVLALLGKKHAQRIGPPKRAIHEFEETKAALPPHKDEPVQAPASVASPTRP